MWVIIQTILDALLILVIVFFIVKSRTKDPKACQKESEALIASLEHFLRDSKEISENFARNLDEKRNLIKGVLTQLDDKISEVKLYLSNLEGYMRDVKSNLRERTDEGSEMRSKILTLRDEGFDIDEIAQKLSRQKDEVQLTLDLEKRI